MPTIKSGSVLLPDVGMSQSSLMIASLLGGFLVYLAMNGKLAAYWSILIGGGSSSASTGATTTTPAASTNTSSSTSTTTPNVSTLPATLGGALGGLGGTTSTATTATGGTGTPVGTGILGLPNTSMSTFYGLGG